ncbi:MAG: glycine cleavage system aminomethyltransferase GcvT [Phocaeicola sp.]|nr:glycine cleavage system aminomethyltransferase GcvT [Phocaeicola sp.]MDD7448728.1 glycine cleavage system aminomethyltransferase GcvT [Prevotellaceae bacterium]MDY3914233.1 glycine cleavage system aminomethyltransferase GcvT [Phocaeicola sp.]MDY5938231.1 glycine cleavage system aminomethyltransferase GcvT [Phocaeicola sp.]
MESKVTCLHDRHVALGAQMVPFGGFDMPLQYSNIIEEHNAVRNACGIFDVSHMGEVLVTGADAEKFVQYIFTNDVSNAPVGKIFYGMMLHPTGGCVDDLLVYKMGENRFFLVINAANIDKDYAWIVEQAKSFNVVTENQSDIYGQVAIQGPAAQDVIEEVLGIPCKDVVFYEFEERNIDGENVIVSRTGYTGEDGFEIYGSHKYIISIWDKLIASKKVLPCGLGCRDTLRFEVGLPLYGDELTDEITPLEAGLGMFVKLEKEDFIGKEALTKQKADGLKRKIIGIELSGRAIPRHGYEVVKDDQVVGTVTTGYNSISTGKSVCMALVNIEAAQMGEPISVRIHRKLHEGVVVAKRFYKKSYKK